MRDVWGGAYGFGTKNDSGMRDVWGGDGKGSAVGDAGGDVERRREVQYCAASPLIGTWSFGFGLCLFRSRSCGPEAGVWCVCIWGV